jgi:hypothetical protein
MRSGIKLHQRARYDQHCLKKLAGLICTVLANDDSKIDAVPTK